VEDCHRLDLVHLDCWDLAWCLVEKSCEVAGDREGRLRKVVPVPLLQLIVSSRDEREITREIWRWLSV
jgi:hypothetical protein